MRIHAIVAVTTLCIMTAIPYARAADADNDETPSVKAIDSPVASSPERGHVSGAEEKLDRGAQLKARIKATEEQSLHPRKETGEAVPLYNKTVHGSEQIKEKMKLSEDAGKRGNQKLASYVQAIFGPGALDDSHAQTKMSFKERLKQEQERQRAKKKHE
jgi:hypothetical protein